MSIIGIDLAKDGFQITVLRWSDRRDDAVGRWLRQLEERWGSNIATVALANKMARIAWRVVARDEAFDVKKAFR